MSAKSGGLKYDPVLNLFGDNILLNTNIESSCVHLT